MQVWAGTAGCSPRPKAKPGSVFPPKSIRGGPLGCPVQPSGLKSRGSGCPLGPPLPARPPYAREPGTKLIVLPSPSLPRSSSCRLSPVLHLPSNLAVCDSNVRPPGKGICWPATGAAAAPLPACTAPPPTPPQGFPSGGGGFKFGKGLKRNASLSTYCKEGTIRQQRFSSGAISCVCDGSVSNTTLIQKLCNLRGRQRLRGYHRFQWPHDCGLSFYVCGDPAVLRLDKKTASFGKNNALIYILTQRYTDTHTHTQSRCPADAHTHT